MKRITLMVCVVLSGCAAPQPYQPTQYEKDRYACLRDESQAKVLPRMVYSECMHAHGWTK